MKKIIIALFFLAAFSSCKKSTDDGGGTPPPTPGTQKDIAAVDDKINNFMTTWNVPGASLAITKNGKLVYAKGYGVADKTSGDKVTPQSRFRLASVSKTYTGVAIMKLVQDGKLNLDSKVFGSGGVLGTTYGTPPYNARVSNITVRHLLQNVSGSWGAATGGDVIDHNANYTNKQLLDWILSSRSNPKDPGTFYDYSNVNFFIAGRIIEKVSGKTYINYLKEDILAPLGITQTDMAGKTEAERKSNEVKYYGQGNDANFPYVIAFPRRDADGGLITTAPELLKFVAAFDGFPTRPDMLNAASIAELTKGSSVFPSYALGIGLWSAENLWYNYGSLPGTRTGFMRHNNGTSIALLFNSRKDPATGESPFVQAMQSMMLDFLKNSYPWQDIDQF